MRKVFTLLLSLLSIHLCLQATVYTVSNDPAKPAQYTDPTTALSAASPGDTLYIYGSPNNYGNFVIDKDITIIGAGFNTRKDVFNKTVFTSIYLYGSTRNGVVLDGLFTQNFFIQPGITVNYANVTLRNSIVSQSFSGSAGSAVGCSSVFSNWLIENSYITNYVEPANSSCNPISPVTSGFLIKNSIVVSTALSYNTTFLNCHFGAGNGGGNNFTNQWTNTYNNCIFYSMTFAQNTTNTNNQFNNCLTYLTQSPSQTFNLGTDWSGGATGTANNCIINQNPLWVTLPVITQYVDNNPVVRNGWNPALQAGSPAINAGTDGTDIGLTGNPVPYSVGAEPKIPVIRRYQLVNAVVPPSGTVTVNATATKAQ